MAITMISVLGSVVGTAVAAVPAVKYAVNQYNALPPSTKKIVWDYVKDSPCGTVMKRVMKCFVTPPDEAELQMEQFIKDVEETVLSAEGDLEEAKRAKEEAEEDLHNAIIKEKEVKKAWEGIRDNNQERDSREEQLACSHAAYIAAKTRHAALKKILDKKVEACNEAEAALKAAEQALSAMKYGDQDAASESESPVRAATLDIEEGKGAMLRGDVIPPEKEETKDNEVHFNPRKPKLTVHTSNLDIEEGGGERIRNEAAMADLPELVVPPPSPAHSSNVHSTPNLSPRPQAQSISKIIGKFKTKEQKDAALEDFRNKAGKVAEAKGACEKAVKAADHEGERHKQIVDDVVYNMCVKTPWLKLAKGLQALQPQNLDEQKKVAQAAHFTFDLGDDNFEINLRPPPAYVNLSGTVHNGSSAVVGHVPVILPDISSMHPHRSVSISTESTDVYGVAGISVFIMSLFGLNPDYGIGEQERGPNYDYGASE